MPYTPGMLPASPADELYLRAQRIVCQENDARASTLQRELSIGYNRACCLIEEMEAYGVVSAPDYVGQRRVLLMPRDKRPEAS